MAARIFAVADAFDAMTNERPYQRATTRGAALDEIERSAGTQFDPVVVHAFLALAREAELIAATPVPSFGD